MAGRTVVFDLDGTLSDPLLGFARSINHALALQGLPERQPHELTRFIGPPLYASAVELTGSADPTRHNKLIADYRRRYGESGYAENTLYAGIPEALAALLDGGCTLGVCTSKRVDFAEKILAQFRLREMFAFVSGGDIGVHKWQQLQALREARHVDGDAVMVGDRDVDITSAHRNGMQACGVLWGFGSLAELEAERPRHLVREPSELAKVLQG